MPPTLRKTLEKDLGELIALAPEAETFLNRAGVSGPAAFKVQLALEETIRNLIEHDPESRVKRIRVAIEVGAQAVTILLEDDGAPFDPSSAPPFDPARPLEARAPHGMGVHLLRTFMDEIHYGRQGEFNQLRLVVGK